MKVFYTEEATMLRLSIDVFEMVDDINGTLSGGVEAPRVLIGVTRENGGVKIKYTYQPFCGLSDCRYRDNRAGQIFEDILSVVNNRLLINGGEFCFGDIHQDPDVEEIIKRVETKYGISVERRQV